MHVIFFFFFGLEPFSVICSAKGRENLVTEFSEMSLWILPSSVATRLKVVLAAFRTETNHSFCGPNHKVK